MNRDHSRQLGQLYHDALARPADERAAFLADACGGDQALRQAVASMLDQAASTNDSLGVPAPRLLASLETAEEANRFPRLGDTLGAYRVERLLGRGGMGAVFLGYDTTLHRRVALKVLTGPGDKDAWRARLIREARSAAALNHPNICTIHEIGDAGGAPFIAMEYVEGRSLRDRLDERALPLAEAVRYGIQAADALAYAHDHGVIHRDFKAANVIVSSEGRLKIVDFGLARRGDATMATTMTSLVPAGVAAGTPYAMAPEQVRGEAADARTDIWALGVLLHEMVGGTKPFTAATLPELFSSILRDTPAQLPDAVPVQFRTIVEHCLEKESARRYQHAGDVRAALETLTAGAGPRSTRRRDPAGRRWWLAATMLAGTAVAASVYVLLGPPSSQPSGPPAPAATNFIRLTAGSGIEWFPTLSPDGRWVAYAADGAGNRDIYLQSASGQTPINLTGDSLEDDDQPAFSPDGERIVFRSDRDGGGLFVMGRTGEAGRRVTRGGFNPAWSPDGAKLVYATESVDVSPLNYARPSELWIVDLNGTEPRRLTDGDAVQPAWSPNGRWIAYMTRLDRPNQFDIQVIPADGGTSIPVTAGPATDWNPVWAPDGRSLYFASDRGGAMNLWRVPIDEQSGAALGEPQAITTPTSYIAHLSTSADGRRLAYSSVLQTANIQRLSLDPATGAVDNQQTEWLTTGSRSWSSPDPSPDGEWVTFYSRLQPEGHLYVVRSDGTGLRQLTSDAAVDRVPRWSPDGRWILFFSNRSGRLDLWKIRPDGSDLQQLTEGGIGGYPFWSPDGSRASTTAVVETGAATSAVLFDPNRPWAQQTPERLPAPTHPASVFLANSWSSDGERLVGTAGLTPPLGIATYSLRSRSYEQLTDFGEWPVWFSDGRHVLFVAGGTRFFVVDTQTKATRQVFSVNRDVIGPPRLTRDGRTAFFSRRVTEADVWLMTLD